MDAVSDPWPEGFAEGEANRAALLVLLSLAAILPRHLLAAARRRGTAAACLDEVRTGRVGSETDRAMAGEIRPEQVADALARCEARLVAPGEGEYPAGLDHLTDPPAGLFVRGRALDSLVPRVAVVGARNCSPLGRDVAHEIGSGLAIPHAARSFRAEALFKDGLASAQLPRLVQSHVLGSLPGRHAFKRFARAQQLLDVVDGQSNHADARERRALNQTTSFQRSDRLA